MGGRISTDVVDGVGYLILDQPERRNAVNFAMYSAIPDAMAAFAADDGVRVVVVRGAADKAFSAGADISEFDERRTTDEGRREYDAASHAAYCLLYTSPSPRDRTRYRMPSSA